MTEYVKVKEDTKCWDCAKACVGGCSWSREFIPVEGWDAKETENAAGVTSYIVRECPEFESEPEEHRIPNLNTEGCLAMVERLMEITRDDYIKGTPVMQDQMDRFFRGKGAGKVHMISDPEGVIRMLRAASVEYKKKKAQKKMVKGWG